MARAARLTGAVAACALLCACAAQPPHWTGARSYTVRPNDTVYSIAFRHGLDWRDVARWNGIDPPGYLIRPGQVLVLDGEPAAAPQRAPATPRRTTPTADTTAAASGVRFRWPADGETTRDGNGVSIAGRIGQPIVAAAPGRVVYTGGGLIGYGQLIIVKHDNRLLSAYAHNREILVREGEEVTAGQRIATMGEGPARRAMLHFEIRIDGDAVDPLQHLPPR